MGGVLGFNCLSRGGRLFYSVFIRDPVTYGGALLIADALAKYAAVAVVFHGVELDGDFPTGATGERAAGFRARAGYGPRRKEKRIRH